MYRLDAAPASSALEIANHSRRRFLRHSLSGGLYAGFVQFAPVFAANEASANIGNPMAYGQPSRTALGAALLRAAHQLLDEPRVLDDPIALRIIGSESESQLRTNLERFQTRRALRAFVAVRSRYAEDELQRAIARGVRQYVVLGAGLDTFAYRNPHPHSLRVFEVDHPATQSWKRRRLEQSGITVPDSLTFAPVDFERQTLTDGLEKAGFNAREPAFFSMLGVAIYLTQSALAETLKFVASLRAGSEIVFCYSIPSSHLSDAQKIARAASEKAVAAIGEPWISYYDPPALQADLRQMGFTDVEDVGPREANARYFTNRTDGLVVGNGGHLMRARV